MTKHHVYHTALLGFELESVRMDFKLLVVMVSHLHEALEVSATDDYCFCWYLRFEERMLSVGSRALILKYYESFPLLVHSAPTRSPPATPSLEINSLCLATCHTV